MESNSQKLSGTAHAFPKGFLHDSTGRAPLSSCSKHLVKLLNAGMLACALAVTVPQSVKAQETKPLIQSTLVGTVLDAKTKEPLVGVTVQIKGTTHGATTNIQGKFNFITGQKFPYTLIISYIGYEKQEVVVNGSPVTIALKETSNQLNDVVVVGYGTQRRKDVTGSIASIRLDELKGQTVSSPERYLQGTIPGVQVTQSTGQPGAGTSVQVRGTASLTAGSQPLYVIDGFPFYNDESLNDAGVTNGPKINPLSTLNAADIEAIDVLKDASSAAIYGSRGANGVIIITTKKGSPGKSSINYDGYYGQQSVVKTIPLLNAYEWGVLRNDALLNTTPTATPYYTQAELDALGTGTDWQAAAFRKAGVQSHNLSVIAGSEKTRLAISGNYFKQDGVLQNTDFIRYSGRINVEHQYNDKLKLLSFVTGSNTKAQVAPANVVPNLLLMSPAVPIYNADGSFYLKSPYEGTYANPINTLYNQLNETRTNFVLANTSAEYSLLKGLTAKISGGALLIDNKQNRYLPSSVYEGSTTSGYAQVGNLFTTKWLNENTLTYQTTFNKRHSLTALVGFTQESTSSKGAIAGSTGFTTDETEYNDLGSGTTPLTPTSSERAYALKSYLARVNYGLNNRYLFTVTYRADGSSKFGIKWGSFPSGAFAWNAGDESFIKNLAFISNLKLRLSAGSTGNQEIPPYQSQSRLSYYRYNFNGTNVSGYAPISNENTNLTWEKTAQYNLGADIGLFHNRISIVADVYYKKTTDLLLNVTVPATSGVLDLMGTNQTQIYQNVGEVENKGFELAVSSHNLTKGFKWNTNVVLGINRNKVLDLGGVPQIIPNSALPSIAAVGYSVGSFIVYKTDGLIAEGTDAAKALTPTKNKLAGAQQYVDKNGDGAITQADDRFIINNQPLFTAGLTNTFSFKGFNLTVFLQSSYGNKLYNQNRGTLELGTGYTNATRNLLDRYSATNKNTDVHIAYRDPSVTISDRFIEDASYLRLKNVQLAYNFPVKLINRATIHNLRLYVSGQNLYTWTKYTGYDPEVSSNGQSAINMGVDNGAYPNSKTLTGGLSLTF